MERELAEILRTAGAPSPHAVAELDGLLDAEGAELNPEQRDAVKTALTYSISLMTGGAGSGKTYAVSTITSIADRLELKRRAGGTHRQGGQTTRTGCWP